MKKVFGVMFVLMFVFSLSLVSATTIITGTIYNADYSDTVFNATVEVTCNGNQATPYPVYSFNDGTYMVEFSNKDCDDGDMAFAHAICVGSQCTETVSGNIIVGENTKSGEVHDCGALIPSLNIGDVDVPLVPEFGFFVGMLTILSAGVIFCVVRRN